MTIITTVGEEMMLGLIGVVVGHEVLTYVIHTVAPLNPSLMFLIRDVIAIETPTVYETDREINETIITDQPTGNRLEKGEDRGSGA